MFPFRDHNPSGRTPYVTYALIAVNVLVFLSYIGLMGTPWRIGAFYAQWGIVPARIMAGDGYETLVTSMFLHGGFMHIAGNMLFLWVFGDNLEDEMGHLRYLLFYLACGIGSGLLHVAMAPASYVPTVGASGAIAGVMGGYLLLFPKAKVDIVVIIVIFFKVFTIPAWIVLAIWFGLQFFGGLGADPDVGGVAYWAHVGGFVVGLVLTWPFFQRRGGSAYWHENKFQPPHPEAKYDPSRIPVIRRKRR